MVSTKVGNFGSPSAKNRTKSIQNLTNTCVIDLFMGIDFVRFWIDFVRFFSPLRYEWPLVLAEGDPQERNNSPFASQKQCFHHLKRCFYPLKPMFLESKNAVFASKKCRILTMRSLSTTYQTLRELRFYDRKGSWWPKCALFALNEVKSSRSFKKLTNGWSEGAGEGGNEISIK